jgi:hypothetical protein
VLEAAGHVPLFTVAVVLTDPLPPRLTAREVAEATGLDVDAVMLVREAVGFPVSDPDERSVPASQIDDGAVISLGFEIFDASAPSRSPVSSVRPCSRSPMLPEPCSPRRPSTTAPAR